MNPKVFYIRLRKKGTNDHVTVTVDGQRNIGPTKEGAALLRKEPFAINQAVLHADESYYEIIGNITY